MQVRPFARMIAIGVGVGAYYGWRRKRDAQRKPIGRAAESAMFQGQCESFHKDLLAGTCPWCGCAIINGKAKYVFLVRPPKSETNPSREYSYPDSETLARFLGLQDLSDVNVHYFPALGRLVVLTADEGKLALALRNSRSVSDELCWDVDVLSRQDFERTTNSFRHAVAALSGVDEPLADLLVSEGFLSFDDLSIIDPDDLREYGHLSEEVTDRIIQQAESKAEEIDRQS
jgi:hypothetical protein